MPEGYTHVRIAKAAAAAVRRKLRYPAAFAAGANGPDTFFCFEAWKRASKRRYDLPALGRRLHNDTTGALLQSLVAHARTAAQRDYVLGFLSHYAADCVLHPYVAALCEPGQPYAGAGGHGYFEIALDSELHKQDTGSPVVWADDAAPVPVGAELGDIVALLSVCLREVYGIGPSAEVLADSFYYSNRLRRLFTSRFGARRLFYALLDPFFGGRGSITGHVSPRRLKTPLPQEWTDPYSGQERSGDAFALLEQAQSRSEQYMAAAILVWAGRQPPEVLVQLLGSMSYAEGRPTAESDPDYVPPPAPPEPRSEEPAAPAGEAASADDVALAGEAAPADGAGPEAEPAPDAAPAGPADDAAPLAQAAAPAPEAVPDPVPELAMSPAPADDLIQGGTL